MSVTFAAVKRVVRRALIRPTVPLTALKPVPMQRLIEHGRCIYDGYQRGTALKYGTLADEVWLDPVFRRALAAARLPPCLPVRNALGDRRQE